jgi:hypothetical protein
MQLTNLEVTSILTHTDTSKFDMTLSVRDVGGSLKANNGNNVPRLAYALSLPHQIVLSGNVDRDQRLHPSINNLSLRFSC